MNNKVISSVGIIGCGWLGSALATQLKQQGISVLATRSNLANVDELKCQGINAEVLSLPAEQETLNCHPVFNQQCLVIAITPQFRQGRVDYAEKVKQLVDAAKINNKVEKIVLLSSTAVYNGLSGDVYEDITLDESADKVPLLNAAEQAVLSFNSIKSSSTTSKSKKTNVIQEKQYNKSAFVLRLSGLVGPNRHPGKFLLNGRMLKSPQAIVNLIHQQDAMGLILSILQSDIRGGIFNGVSATQVTKKQYYQRAAKSLKLPTPIFEESNSCLDVNPKVVSGKKTRDELNYSFIYDDLFNWLEQ